MENGDIPHISLPIYFFQRVENTCIHHGFRISFDVNLLHSKWSATCVVAVTTNVVLWLRPRFVVTLCEQSRALNHERFVVGCTAREKS